MIICEINSVVKSSIFESDYCNRTYKQRVKNYCISFTLFSSSWLLPFEYLIDLMMLSFDSWKMIMVALSHVAWWNLKWKWRIFLLLCPNKFHCDKENIWSNNSECWIVSRDDNGWGRFNAYGGLRLMRGRVGSNNIF